jgi:uncharacterized protein (TIGR00255 family)
LEASVKEKVKKVCQRGKVDGSIRLESMTQSAQGFPHWQEPAVRHYASLLSQFEELTGREVQVSMKDLLSQRDLLGESVDLEIPPELGEKLIWESLELALQALKSMKEREGQAMLEDIQSRLQRCAQLAQKIEENSKHLPQQFQQRLLDHLSDLQAKLDAERLHQEVALMAERLDISEEIVRFDTHLQHLQETLQQKREIGKRGDFLLQELNREANTMASKCNDTSVSHTVVEIKAELEKIREQMQNIE